MWIVIPLRTERSMADKDQLQSLIAQLPADAVSDACTYLETLLALSWFPSEDAPTDASPQRSADFGDWLDRVKSLEG